MGKLRVADLFCGTGALSSGFSATGEFRVVLGIDIRPSSIATFTANHPSALAICSDIRDVRITDVAERLGEGLDVIVAGPPCQGFSSIRPYRSISENDVRNNLFEEVLLFVRHFKPQLVVFENVVGLVRHSNGRVLSAIEQSFQAAGYSTNMGVLNAVNYGVPQRRERLILLAFRGMHRPRLPEPTHHFVGRTMAGTAAIPNLPLFSQDLPPAITVDQAIGDLPPVAAGKAVFEYDELRPLTNYARQRRKGSQHLRLHHATGHTPRMLEIIKHAGANRWALPEGLTTSGFSSCYSRLSGDAPSTTITVNFVHPASNRCIHPYQNRALTPREGARLQGFDDDFEFCGSRSHIVKQIGEAVPPILGAAVAGTVLDQLQ
jgi:DNA (cytosine-5)-methyltransferase 1